MDINLLRTLVTVLSFGIFVGIVWWALSKSNRSRFEEAAMLPFADDDTSQRKDESQNKREQR
jgi:cytochrome c oxidase cbb3-type subunit IV